MTRNLLASGRGPLRIVILTLLATIFAATGAFGQARYIYNENADAHAEVRDALARAAREHKRILLDFGGNWCGDCQVLDIYFHRDPNAALLADNYILVDIDIGRMDKNVDIAQRYNVPLQKGVPALAVLDAHGRLLYSQTNGEFEAMRRMDPNSVTQFLERWKATRD
ncbi:MAG TPA: thioredoxin family protein [Acidobacteriaceae bacterium]|nr:thioredoxin family protein [Acidobacteriaceae bacterium]